MNTEQGEEQIPDRGKLVALYPTVMARRKLTSPLKFLTGLLGLSY